MKKQNLLCSTVGGFQKRKHRTYPRCAAHLKGKDDFWIGTYFTDEAFLSTQFAAVNVSRGFFDHSLQKRDQAPVCRTQQILEFNWNHLWKQMFLLAVKIASHNTRKFLGWSACHFPTISFCFLWQGSNSKTSSRLHPPPTMILACENNGRCCCVIWLQIMLGGGPHPWRHDKEDNDHGNVTHTRRYALSRAAWKWQFPGLEIFICSRQTHLQRVEMDGVVQVFSGPDTFPKIVGNGFVALEHVRLQIPQLKPQILLQQKQKPEISCQTATLSHRSLILPCFQKPIGCQTTELKPTLRTDKTTVFPTKCAYMCVWNLGDVVAESGIQCTDV